MKNNEYFWSQTAKKTNYQKNVFVLLVLLTDTIALSGSWQIIKYSEQLYCSVPSPGNWWLWQHLKQFIF